MIGKGKFIFNACHLAYTGQDFAPRLASVRVVESSDDNWCDMKAIDAKCGHVKRRLNKGEPLEGKVLEFALSIIGETNNEFLNGIAEKLKAGINLDDYEQHIMVDVLLLHVKLSA